MAEPTSAIQSIQTFHTLVPATETPFSVMTSPSASCTLSLGEGSTPITLDADDNGVVRFHITADEVWQPTDLSLKYAAASGANVLHTLSLRDAAHTTGPVSPNEVTAAPVGTLRPALTGNPMALSNTELVAKGYPPRPNPTGSPNRYATWLQLVSEPYTAVNPRLVPRPQYSFGGVAAAPDAGKPLPDGAPGLTFNANNGTWSGAYLTNPIKQFYSIEATWVVPKILAEAPGLTYAAAAQWVGLDNSSTDLYQSGSDCEGTRSSGVTVTNYWVWTERLPFAPAAVPNMPIAPGDSMLVQIFVADQNGQTWFVNSNGTGGLTSKNTSVWIMVYNLTQKHSYWGTLPMAAQTLGGTKSTPFTGSTAEFIVERPSHNGTSAELAFFGTFRMQGCGWGDSNYGDTREFALPPDTSANPPSEGRLSYLNMVNGKDTLCLVSTAQDTATPSRQAIVFNWQRYT